MDEKTLALLDKPFTIEEHGYVERVGFYILKAAIHRRLREIDPRFRTTPPEIMLIDEDIVVMRGGLTLFGETRYAVGTGKIDRVKFDKDRKEIPLSNSEIVRNRLKALKQAASDLLPRGAQQFGIGDYLRDVPRDDRTREAFPAYLRTLMARWEAAQQPPHWALNGGGKRVKILLDLWGFGTQWNTIRTQIEPGLVLTRMSDTTLSEVEFIARMVALKDARDAGNHVDISTQNTEAAHVSGS